ncbi:hypothetical protein N0V82_000522 [Gnomoniopsis sp. IMI 355080]|nr:hypothetical protein N0V82_000522 [Gnomoniopsis sp. IMI 355080]
MNASHHPSSDKMTPDMSIEDKEAFYKQLDELEASLKEDDEPFDHSRQVHRAFFAKANQRKQTSATPIPPSSSTPSFTLIETHALPEETPATTNTTSPVIDHQTIRRRRPTSTSSVKHTPDVSHPPATAKLMRTRTTPNTLTPGSFAPSTNQQAPLAMAGSSSRQRSVKGKAKATEVIPESEQRLKGLRLFYIPGERIKLRKQRMERAEGHGAVVIEELSEATHVVVDENLTYEDIKAHVSPVLGKGEPIIVTDQWPLECIARKVVFPPSRKYRPKGMPTGEPAPATAAVPAVSEAKDDSLELKPPGNRRKGWDHVSPETTQSGTSSVRPIDHIELPSELNQPRSQEAMVSVASDSPPGARCGAGEFEALRPSPVRRSSYVFADELAQIVHQVREDFKDVPRIGEDDASDHGEWDKDQAVDSDTDEERERKRRKKDAAKRTGKQMKGNEKFRCHTGGIKDKTVGQENPNALVISVLKQMSEYYAQTNDRWRPIAYRRAITELESITDRKINTAEEAMELPCFGPRLAEKLEEIVNTHSLARLDYALNDPMGKISTLFLGIYGVGKATADKWIAQGFRTLDDLLQKAKLTNSQRMGIDHYQDLNTRIPREEVTKLGECVKAEAAKIDHNVHLIIGGSYRRGADTSGDIDFIITKKGTTSSKDLVPFLDQLVGNLWRQGFIMAELAAHSSDKDSSGSKWHGCCVLPRIAGFNDDEDYRPIWRRIDFLLVPETEFGAALIYFTGNDIFNRSLRLLASKKGMRLNQRGLYKDVMRGANREKLTEGELVEGKDEKKIFEILNVKWREPSERWC